MNFEKNILSMRPKTPIRASTSAFILSSYYNHITLLDGFTRFSITSPLLNVQTLITRSCSQRAFTSYIMETETPIIDPNCFHYIIVSIGYCWYYMFTTINWSNLYENISFTFSITIGKRLNEIHHVGIKTFTARDSFVKIH